MEQWYQPYSPPDKMYYEHEVGFKSLIEYGMNDLCARGLNFGHRWRRPDGYDW